MYKKTYETKIIRIEHEVTIYQNADAQSIKKDLEHVPDRAKLIEVSEPEKDLDGLGKGNVEIILTFLEEQKEK